MNFKINFSIFLALLLIPIVSADVIVRYDASAIYLFPLVLVIELIAFWLSANKIFKIQVGFWKSLLIVFIANFVTSLIGILIGFGFHSYNDFIAVFIAFFLSAIIEFVIFLLFFINKKASKINLLWISLITNLASYLFLFAISLFLIRLL